MSPSLALWLGLTLLTWASAFTGIRYALLHGFTPGHLALLRFLFCSASYVTYFAFTRRWPALPRRRDVPAFLACGFFSVFAYPSLLNFGEIHVPAGAAALLVNSAPVFTALLAHWFLAERLGRMRWAGIWLSMGGIALITVSQTHLDDLHKLAADRDGFIAAVAILLAAICTACHTIVQKRCLTRYKPVDIAAYVVWCGTLGLMIYTPGLTRETLHARTQVTLVIAYLGIVPAAFGTIVWAHAVIRISASRVISYLYLVPPMAIVIAYVLLGEVPRFLSLVGGALAIAGVIIVNYRRRAVTTPAVPE